MKERRLGSRARHRSTRPTPQLSPDGKWVSYDSNEVGNADLYVARSTDVTARVLVAQASSRARWSPAAPELFFIQAGRLMSLRYEARAGPIIGLLAACVV